MSDAKDKTPPGAQLNLDWVRCGLSTASIRHDPDETIHACIAEIERLRAQLSLTIAAGSVLWMRAHAVSVRETYDKDLNEVGIEELPPDTVVFEYDHGDGIPAKAIVELNHALDNWQLVKKGETPS